MTTLSDRTITALRGSHDELVGIVPSLLDDQLTSPSGAAEWTVAQVLSHLGSGAEIARAGLLTALGDDPPPQQHFNQSVWDRWNALDPREQATAFLEHNAAVVETLESLTPSQRQTLKVDLGYLPEPVTVASFAGMRLNETALHSWDVRVALDPSATLDAPSAEVLIEHFASELGFLLGFMGRANLPEAARVQIGERDLAIAIDDKVSLRASSVNPTATFNGDVEAVIRLFGGRLGPRYTPRDLAVTGNVTLDGLRRVFPGY